MIQNFIPGAEALVLVYEIIVSFPSVPSSNSPRLKTEITPRYPVHSGSFSTGGGSRTKDVKLPVEQADPNVTSNLKLYGKIYAWQVVPYIIPKAALPEYYDLNLVYTGVGSIFNVPSGPVTSYVFLFDTLF